MCLTSHRAVFIFRSWLDLQGVVLGFWISTVKIFKSLKTINTGFHKYRKIQKYLESSSGHTLSFLSKFGEISFQENICEGISHPFFYGDLVYKLRRIKHSENFVSPGSTIVKRLRRQMIHLILIIKIVKYRFKNKFPSDWVYDPVIIERTRCLNYAWPFYSFIQIFPMALHSDQQGGGDYTSGLVQASSEEKKPLSLSLWLLVRTPSAFRFELDSRR